MKWISVKDRMPDCDNCVIVYDAIDKKVTIAERPHPEGSDGIWLGTETEAHYQGREALFKVTHWMPLPEVPEK